MAPKTNSQASWEIKMSQQASLALLKYQTKQTMTVVTSGNYNRKYNNCNLIQAHVQWQRQLKNGVLSSSNGLKACGLPGILICLLLFSQVLF